MGGSGVERRLDDRAHLTVASATPALIRVLLIEDNIGFAYLVRDVLTRQHPGRFLVEEAHTLAEGVVILDRGETDLLLLDLGLPDSTRIHTFAAAAAHASRIPIIILTVLDDDDLAMQAMRMGAQDYLVKDQVDKTLLARSIRYALERARAERMLHDLSARLLDLQDEERRRIARELHDTTAQTLSALCMTLSLADRRGADAASTQSLLVESQALADQALKEVRTLSYLLHPPLLDELGLSGAVRDYADGFAERSGVRVDLELPSNLGRLPKDVETALFRVMQECLTNIHRHSGSRTASIRLSRTPSGVHLEVRDTGRGMPEGWEAEPGSSLHRLGVGIAGMRERVRQLGGRLDIRSSAIGTIITAIVPSESVTL